MTSSLSLDEPVRSLRDFGEPSIWHEVVHALSNARVLWIDTQTLETDFPHLARAALDARLGSAADANQHRARLEAWLLRNAAVISDPQARQERTNSPIETTGDLLIAHRLPRYGRAVVMSTRASLRKLPHARYLEWHDEPDGLLDIKGVGVPPGARPEPKLHQTGLLPLSEAFTEVLRQRLIEAIFRHAEVDLKGVGIYGILDLGFRVKTPSEHIPAAAIVRRAHLRAPGGVELPAHGSPEQRILLQVELLLRLYGVTSTNPTRLEVREGEHGLIALRGLEPLHADVSLLEQLVRDVGRPPPWEMAAVNVQLTRHAFEGPLRARLVDFGQYQFEPRFELPLLSLVHDRFLQWGGAMWPTEPGWIQPDPQLAVRREVVAYRPIGASIGRLAAKDPEKEMPGDRYFGYEMVRRLEEDDLDPSSAEAAIQRFIAEATAPWRGEQP